jgi:hypothetical protein
MICPNSGHSTYRDREVVVCVACKALVRVVVAGDRRTGTGTLAKHEVPV